MSLNQKNLTKIYKQINFRSTGKIEISKKDILDYYKKMLFIRRFEEKAGQAYSTGLIGGFCHLYIGQESVAVGMQQALKDHDSIITSYRDHGVMLATGSDPKAAMAELFGKSTGCSKGKGGSMHMFDTEKGFYGGHGIVGASVPLGTGIAFANKYEKDNSVCVTYFGDGAANQGQVYESFNMAALWGLPVIYVIENNEYAMGTSVERASATTELYQRGESFGIPGYQIDGMDIFKVIEAAKMAVEYARHSRPIVLEMKTYRYRGHSMSDPATYRTKEEVEKYKKNRDPIEFLKKRALADKIASEEDFKVIEKDVKAIIIETMEYATQSALPDSSEIWTDVFADDNSQNNLQ